MAKGFPTSHKLKPEDLITKRRTDTADPTGNRQQRRRAKKLGITRKENADA